MKPAMLSTPEGAFSAQVYELVGGHGLKQTNFCGQYYVLDKSQGGHH